MTDWLPWAAAFVMFAQGAALAPARVAGPLAWRAVGLRALSPLAATGIALALGLPVPVALGLLLASLAPPAVGGLTFAALTGANVTVLSGLVLIGTALAAPLLVLIWGTVAVMPTLTWAALPFLLGFALRGVIARRERPLSLAASAVSGAMVIVTLWAAWGDPLAAPDLAAMAAILLVLTAGAAAGLLTRGRPADEAGALFLAAVLPVPALPIGLAAALLGGEFAPAALPAALTAVAGYALAIALLILRLRTGRR